MPKKLLSLILALTLALSLAVPAFAVTPEDAQEDAMLLYNLGLFKGTGTTADGSPKFDLDRAPPRPQAVTIMVRLQGAEEAALKKTIATPFTDVPAWAQGYVNLCSSLGIVAGVGDGKFDPNATVTTAQAVLMLCRALGYFQNAADFGDNWMLAATAKGTALGLYGDLKLTANAGLTATTWLSWCSTP